MKVIVPVYHRRQRLLIIGVYTDINRAKRAVCQADNDPRVFEFLEFEINDGIVDEVKKQEPLTFAKIRQEYLENGKE